MESRAPDESGISGAEESPGRLSLPAQIFMALAVAVVLGFTAWHLATVFLYVSPPNTVSKQHKETIDGYVLPEFEQNWKLFAPNPLQQNIDVQARAEVQKKDGSTEQTPWVNLSAQDAEAIKHNPAPSHTEQNELRRAWDYFINSHDEKNRPNGVRGELSEQYLKRIVMLRFGPVLNDGKVQSIQLRAEVTPLAAPDWSADKRSTQSSYRQLGWWQVTTADLQKGDRETWSSWEGSGQ
ncbi:hypothetical protein G5C51_16250 [Streptomyces sp. A7024]|uniref:Uncharacterized protein n=1 Tax=Streptomyces coryli TaxID=1128680 RepID=A0A6G4U0C1_9ACTN|nr:DUF5819 family protein [Streptomyces coryli]NGN65442.1 hypothetical protein [Streptomyces coryli]